MKKEEAKADTANISNIRDDKDNKAESERE
jgi:hypothetical protein